MARNGTKTIQKAKRTRNRAFWGQRDEADEMENKQELDPKQAAAQDLKAATKVHFNVLCCFFFLFVFC